MKYFLTFAGFGFLFKVQEVILIKSNSGIRMKKNRSAKSKNGTLEGWCLGRATWSKWTYWGHAENLLSVAAVGIHPDQGHFVTGSLVSLYWPISIM